MSKFHNIKEKDEQDILNNSFRNMIDKHSIQEKYNVSPSTSDRVITKLNLYHAPNHLIKISKRYLNGESIKQLAKEFNRSITTITYFFNRHKIPIRNTIYFCNFNYFNNIDSEEKAYFLGFIYADGCLYKNSLKINLAIKDIEILNKFKKSINSNHPLKIINCKTTYGNNTQCRFEITQKKLREDLINVGVFERKTEILKFPYFLSNELQRHFIRGYFDGDGSVGKYKIKINNKNYKNDYYLKYNLSLCGTELFLNEFRKIFKNISGVNGCYCKRHKNSINKVSALCYSGGKCIKKILSYLYCDSNVYLNRKFNKYLEICT